MSTSTYFSAEALASQGFEVTVLSNCSETEASLRQYSTDNTVLVEAMDNRVQLVTLTEVPEYGYVPWATPTLSRLIGAGLRIVQEKNIDLIVGWYFEPFGVAASIVGKLTGIPYFIRHAGSDLAKLSDHPDLRETYISMIAGAAAILTSGHSVDVKNRLNEHLKADRAKIISLHPCKLPKAYLSKKKRPAESAETIRRLTKRNDWFVKLGLSDDIVEWLSNHRSNYDEAAPCIGIYGKVGRVKGTWDLMAALEEIGVEGTPFNLVCLSGGKPSAYADFLSSLHSSPILKRRAVVLPPCLPQETSEFLSAMDAVCCLERNFPVAIHAPRLPREVLASGACLVVSREIADKQAFRDSLVHGKNCFIVRDPTDRQDLANVLRQVVSDVEETSIIGKHGWYVSQTFEKLLVDQDAMATAIADLFEELHLGKP